MTFYEKELHRLFDDSERISMDTVFAGKTMITKIGEDLRAKVQFVNTKISGQYPIRVYRIQTSCGLWEIQLSATPQHVN